ncbi:MAG: histidine phosphatase family protein [Clostridia bacterium]|nr:histidine phosphatase family protein [Clostridia bacterium]
MKLYLLRHGQTPASEKHLYCGKTDVCLSENGLAALKEKRAKTADFSPASLRVVSSGMLRCEQTLTALFSDLAHEIDPAFCEMDFGDFEMRSYEELKNDPAYLAWIDGDNEANVAPGGESGEGLRARVLPALERLICDGRDTLLVTHGGVIALIMAHLFPAENKSRYAWQPAAGSGYAVDLAAHAYRPFF